jgi:hypothetical protein
MVTGRPVAADDQALTMLWLDILASYTGHVRIRHGSPRLRDDGAAQASELQGRC